MKPLRLFFAWLGLSALVCQAGTHPFNAPAAGDQPRTPAGTSSAARSESSDVNPAGIREKTAGDSEEKALFVARDASPSAAWQEGLVYYQPFDRIPQTEIRRAGTATRQSPSYFLVHTSTYSEGLAGNALDLTDEVAFRIPLSLEASDCPSFGENDSFSLQVWVQTKPGAPQGTPIWTNQATHMAEPGHAAGASDTPGWCIGTQENGAWYLRLNDGETSYTYLPTADRQAINDGRWHQITLSLDKTKGEAWMYLDGRNVAVYRIQGLKSLESKLRTVLGGSDENQDWECRGEWMAFNGKIDEARIWNRPLTAAEVTESYRRFFPMETTLAAETPQRLKVQVWNIWHGGRRFGKQVGVQRVVDVLKKENADVIGLVETYGSGAIIADSLGYYFYLISSNLSILSRYPIEETISVFKPFNAGGAFIRLSERQKIAFFDIWLHYLPDITDLNKGKAAVRKYEEEESKTRLPEIRAILQEIAPQLAAAEQTPVLLVGDFNVDSHLDWTDETRLLHSGVTVRLPVSEEVQKAGFHDSFRELSPDARIHPGTTWSPLVNLGAEQVSCIPQRIDFIYYKGNKLIPYRSESLRHHPVGWPSDHGSVVSSFYLEE